MIEWATIGVGLFSGVIASVSGVGIGGFMTPVFAIVMGTGIAIGAVSVVHFFGTILRFLMWWKHIRWKILLTFGLLSAAGGVIGAIYHNSLGNDILTATFGVLLIFAGALGIFTEDFKLKIPIGVGFIVGAFSGFFGGLVGNQGSLRSAALLGFDINKKEFIATATGVALMVDLARVPTYISADGAKIFAQWPLITVGSVSVLIGTLLGGWVLEKIPEYLFTHIVSALLFAVGVAVIVNLWIPIYTG